MYQKIVSFLKALSAVLVKKTQKISERLNAPFFLKIRLILRTFSFKQKLYLMALIILVLTGLFGLIWKIDRSLAVEMPETGGTLTEGIIGTPRFINPLLAISDADRDLTNLVYSGLLRADGKEGLIPDLAEKYEISEDGLSYAFTLKENLVWSDKEPLTSDDVIFTVKQAKDPVLKSNQRASWEGVEVEKIDDRTIRFSLKRPYAPFIENMTLGILPGHIWQDIAVEQMSLTDFNVNPVGSGPYEVSGVIKDSTGIIQSYILTPNKKFALGKPYINNLILKFYPSEKKLIEAYKNGDIDSVGGISPKNMEGIKGTGTNLRSLFLPRVFAVFFNQNNAQFLANRGVRRALNLATDKEKIISEVLKNFGSSLSGPLPPGSLGVSPLQEKITQKSYEENLKEARGILEKAGWKLNEQDKIFEKMDKKKIAQKLEISLSTSNSPELVETANLLKTMWENLGVKLNVKIFEIGDLNQDIIRPRKYDALLFGIMMGRDPDPFAFWHSSQRNDPGLNIALYTNIAADKLLEEARAVSDTEKREEKYRSFQEQVEMDIPAIFLYSPEYIYLALNNLKGFDTENITIPSERFSQVYKWYIDTEKVWKIFAK